MKIQNKKTVSIALMGVLATSALGGVFAPAAEAQSSKKWRNFAIAGGAIAGYGLLKKNKTATIAGAALGGYSLYRSSKARKNEKRRSQSWYKQRYGRNWRAHYRS
ncbi:hypothetical protein EON83_07390 [bacterium]|nr:MAG: hypothetical protein EON83_07390 [bacterium]